MKNKKSELLVLFIRTVYNTITVFSYKNSLHEVSKVL